MLPSASSSNTSWLALPPGRQPSAAASSATWASLYYHKLREIIAERIRDESPFGGEIERIAHDPDESYFGGHRKGNRGRGAAGKVVVFGILKRGGRVYTAVAANLKRATLLPIIRERVEPDSVVYTDGLSVSDTSHASGFAHYRIDHCEGLADYDANGRTAHSNGTAMG